MATNQFFQNKGPFLLSKIISEINSKSSSPIDGSIFDVKDLVKAEKNDITFVR